MSIDAHPGKAPLAPPAPRAWGSLVADRQTSQVLRLVLTDRSVSFPIGELKRWEHIAGGQESLIILTSREIVTVEGQHLTEVRQALDDVRLCELRIPATKATTRTGPVVRRITIEPA